MTRKIVAAMGLLFLACALHANELPEAIGSFYEDWNFVVANSTPVERTALWEIRRATGDRLTDAETRILRTLERIAAVVFPDDGTMPVAWADPPVPTSELLAVIGTRHVEADVIVVDLAVTPFPARRARSVGEDSWPQDADPAAFGDLRGMGRYRDRWYRRDGRWKLTRCVAVPVTSASPE
ncbi:MAG: hypothetical protein ACOC2Y_05915 [Spirochaetota bacterium]